MSWAACHQCGSDSVLRRALRCAREPAPSWPVASCHRLLCQAGCAWLLHAGKEAPPQATTGYACTSQVLVQKGAFCSLAAARLTFRYIALPAGAACFEPGCAEKAYNEGGTARSAAGITIGSVAAVHAYCDQLLEIAYKGEAKPKCR